MMYYQNKLVSEDEKMKFSMLFLYFISIIFSINCFPNHLNKDFGDGWYFHFNLGTSASLSQTISFDFQEYPNQKYVAKWRSKSTQDAWYYTARFDKWKDEKNSINENFVLY